jgi:Domain of unknown function (DUF4280)
MAKQMATGAMLTCSFGAVPTVLNVLPQNRVLTTTPAANIMENQPIANIIPFGMCTSMANPAVASATAAAFGVLTPAPCTPPSITPWLPGTVNVLIGGQPALNDMSKCICAYGGVIQATTPGQFTTDEG